jgi:ElaB/YqjD/DUF883 family membrane-anchored ribosome-binding protein
MLESNSNAVNNDVSTLIADAQALLHAAATLTGEKAEELRVCAMELLDKAAAIGRGAQASALVSGKEMAAAADSYVTENPWRAVAALAGVTLLAGVFLGRR